MHRPGFDHRRSLSWWRQAVPALLCLLPALAGAEVFWSVSDSQGRQNWLLGTMHSEDPRLLEWSRPLVDTLQKADRLALELVPDAAMLETLREGMVSSERALSEVLDEPLYDRVVAVLVDKYGMTEAAVDRLRPWAVALTLATRPPETGLYMDLMLSYRAQGAGLEIVPLETIADQADMPLEQQVSLIRETVTDHDAYAGLFDELVVAYLDGDLDRLDRLAQAQMAGLDPEIIRYFDEQGLVARNRRMLERAEPWLDEGGLIIAVGALHLHGKGGLVELLRQRGWTVEGIY